MDVLELFAGSRSIGKEAEKLGMRVFSSDIEQFGGIDYIVDILKFDYKKVPFVPDVIWASPPCTGFSVASIGSHWRGGAKAYVPKSATSKLGIKLLRKTLEIIDYYQEKNPNLIWFIENPRGLMRKMPEMLGLYMELMFRKTITYCQYGDERMKPTDIWTNSKWIPKKACKNGDKCHIAAPRGSKTGTQGRKGSYERSKNHALEAGSEAVDKFYPPSL